MVFKIVDGRSCFYQWDIDRQIEVSDSSIKEVHFCNRTDVCSLVVDVVDGIANVPNKVLQSGFNVRVFGYDGKATMHEATFEVKARTKPTDYVYTEVEIKRYSDLEHRIDEIEKNGISEETINNAVNEYLDKNPIDMEGYATEEYVDEAVKNVEVDLTDYATKSYVSEEIAKVSTGGEINLDGYAKKEDIPDVSKFITSIPEEYVTESELNAKGYAKATALNDKADVNHTHTGYAKTNHTHDQADINGLQLALSEKATQADIEKAIELHNHNNLYAEKEHTHDEYALKGHLHAQYLTEHQSLAGYATEKYVDNAIANIEIPESGEGGAGTPLYQHTVSFKAAGNSYNSKKPSIYVTFISGRATAYTPEALAKYLYDNNAALAVSGTADTSSYGVVPVDKLDAYSTSTFRIYHKKLSNAEATDITTNFPVSEVTDFTDNVVSVGIASVSGGGSGEPADVDLTGYAKYYHFNSLENPSAEDYSKLREILESHELYNYEFTVGDHKVLRTSDLGGLSVLFVYGVFNGPTATTFYGYQLDAANSTSTLLVSYDLITADSVTQIVNDAIANIPIYNGEVE